MSILPPLCLALLQGAPIAEPELPRVLFVTESAGFVHSVVKRPSPNEPSHAERMLAQYARTRLELTVTQRSAAIDEDLLDQYDAVLFFTSGTLPMDDDARSALMEWVRWGGAFVGVHSASGTFPEYPAYAGLLGARFDGHPWHQRVTLEVEAPAHPSVAHLGDSIQLHDEIYQFHSFRRHPVRVLMSLAHDSVDIELGKRADRDYPLAWCKDHGRGRVFYSALGHSEEVWQDERFLEHLVRGIEWAHNGPDFSPAPPKDAVVLFDGTSLGAWMHRGGDEAQWRIVDGAMEVRKGTGNLTTREALGSGLYHIEFNVPPTPETNRWQDRGNSGVYVQGRYEVQILDSLGRDQRAGDCGGIYGKHIASVDACREAGRWQSYDIRFQAPTFDKQGGKRAAARMSVWHNGILIHDDVEIDGTTAAAMTKDEQPMGPLMLQDHGHPVRYRNVWFVPGDV